MAEESTTTSEVIDTLTSGLNSVEAETSDLAGGVRAVVADQEAGKAFGLLRRNGFEFDSKRGPSGDNLVFNIEAEEQQGLGELFK